MIFAQNIDISLNKHYGESSYTVYSNNHWNLKSKLDFPFEFYSINLNYNHNFSYFNFSIFSSFLLNDNAMSGEDFDWQNDNLTVYSKSDNLTDNYYDIGIMFSKKLFDNIDLFLKFNYQSLDMSWLNTYQIDYVKNKDEYSPGKTLKYQQKFYKYHIGINYKIDILDKLFLKIKPSLIYSFINTKDIHILRDFYTIQNIDTFGYEIILDLYYKISFSSNIKVFFSYIGIKEKDVNMDYYNINNEKYISYPSTYNYRSSIVGIAYKYDF